MEMNALINADAITLEWVGIVAKQVESLKFGVVPTTVHEPRVVQIEKAGKVRLGQGPGKEVFVR